MPVPSTRVHVFESLQLFREDLDEIIKIFRQTNPESSVSLEDGERTYESFEEMRTLNGDETSHLILQNQVVGIKLDMQKRNNGLVLTSSKPTDEAELSFYRTRDYLRPKTRPGFTFWQLLPIYSILAGIMGAGWIYDNRNKSVFTATIFPALMFVIIAIVIVTFGNKIIAIKSMFVTLKRRHEYPGFLRRNRDSLAIMVIGTAIGVAATLLIQHLSKAH
jgi:hypothetical protein